MNQEPRCKQTEYGSRFAPDPQDSDCNPKVSPQSGGESSPYSIDQSWKEFSHSMLAYPILYTPGVMNPKYAVERTFQYLAQLNFGDSFLEVGCGTGVISLFVASKFNIPVFALDISSEAILVCQENARNWNLTRLVNTINIDVVNYWNYSMPTVDTIFSHPPYFLNLDERERDKRYFASRSFFASLINLAIDKLNPGGVLICHINSLLTFEFFKHSLLKDKFEILEEQLPNQLDIRDYLMMTEFLLNKSLNIDYDFEFDSYLPHGLGKNTIMIDFHEVLNKGIQSGGWIKARRCV